ncbi:MAG: hypothetical protein JXJ17_06335 [Anaerolineae bacterium]|nr:hypothetical protein [Anaerolineae bacterium]
MSWRTAFENLAAISVTGIATSYDLDDLPNVLPAAELPALVPTFPESTGMLNEDQQGLSTLTYDGAAWLSTLSVDHMLYWTPAWSDTGLTGVLPDLIAAVDDYLEAVSAKATLDGALHAPLAISRVQVGVFSFAGVQYYGVRFRHCWQRIV